MPIIAAAILLGIAIFGIIGGAILVLSGGESRVGLRVRQFVALEAPPPPAVVARTQRGRRSELFAELDARWQRRPQGRQISAEIERAGLTLTVTELGLLRIGSALLTALVLIALLPGWWWLMGLLGLALGAALPLWYIRRRGRTRLRKLDEQLPEILALLAAYVRTGNSLFHGLERIAQEAEEPSRSEYLRVVRTISLGAPLDVALRSLAERMPTEEIEMLTTAVIIQQQTGGNIGHILDITATTVRERHRIQREINVLNAQQRFSAYLLAALPLFLAGVLFLISPSYIGRIFQPGWILLLPISVVILLVVGFVVMNRVARIDV